MESGMVKVMDIPKNTGNTRKWSEIDDNEYLSYKGEGDQAARAKIQQGYDKVMTAYRVADNLQVTYEWENWNKYPGETSRFTSAGRKGTNTIDLDLSHRIGFANETSYTDRDGRTIDTTIGDETKALLSSVHTLTSGATTFRNILANNPRLSKGALEGIERLKVEQTYNHLGELKTGITFDILFTTADPNTVNTAKELLKSSGAPDAAHAGVVNVYSGSYRHVILPRVATTAAGAADTDKRYYWGIASSQLSCFYLGIWERPHLIPPTIGNGEDIQTDSKEFGNRAGYGICIPGANWIKQSLGNGQA